LIARRGFLAALVGLAAPAAVAPPVLLPCEPLRLGLERIKRHAEDEGGRMVYGWQVKNPPAAVPPVGTYARAYWNIADEALREAR
jgi:hypothetical protein